MNFKDLFDSIFSSCQSIIEGWAFKAIFSVTATVLTSTHGSALGAFVILVFIDLLTRWLALAYKYQIDQKVPPDNCNLFGCFITIPDAFRAGYINSDAMKHRFAGKIIVYGLLTMMAANSDYLLRAAGETPIILKMSWIYLATTEALSILENLKEAGVSEAAGLLDFAKDKISTLLGRNKQ